MAKSKGVDGRLQNLPPLHHLWALALQGALQGEPQLCLQRKPVLGEGQGAKWMDGMSPFYLPSANLVSSLIKHPLLSNDNKS